MGTNFIATELSGLTIVEKTSFEDDRGFLSRIWCSEAFAAAGWMLPIAQINHTLTKRRGCVRGLHFQLPPHAEMKLVTCLRGCVFDVAVDLRTGSGTFLRWHAEILSQSNRRSMLIPEGFAHGFQALSEDCELLYLHTAPYHPESERAVNVLDSRVDIAWPLAIADMSDRDRRHPFLKDDFMGIEL